MYRVQDEVREYSRIFLQFTDFCADVVLSTARGFHEVEATRLHEVEAAVEAGSVTQVLPPSNRRFPSEEEVEVEVSLSLQ